MLSSNQSLDRLESIYSAFVILPLLLILFSVSAFAAPSPPASLKSFEALIQGTMDNEAELNNFTFTFFLTLDSIQLSPDFDQSCSFPSQNQAIQVKAVEGDEQGDLKTIYPNNSSLPSSSNPQPLSQPLQVEVYATVLGGSGQKCFLSVDFGGWYVNVLGPASTTPPSDEGYFDVEAIFAPEEVGVGEQVEIAADIANIGGQAGEAQIRFSIDGEVQDSFPLPMDRNEVSGVEFKGAFEFPGNKVVQICTQHDCASTVIEVLLIQRTAQPSVGLTVNGDGVSINGERVPNGKRILFAEDVQIHEVIMNSVRDRIQLDVDCFSSTLLDRELAIILVWSVGLDEAEGDSQEAAARFLLVLFQDLISRFCEQQFGPSSLHGSSENMIAVELMSGFVEMEAVQPDIGFSLKAGDATIKGQGGERIEVDYDAATNETSIESLSGSVNVSDAQGRSVMLNSNESVEVTNNGLGAVKSISRPPSGLSLEQAIDADSSGKLSDSEIVRAIQQWILGEEVPGTGGKTISDTDIMHLVRIWITGERVSRSNSVSSHGLHRLESRPLP